MTEKKNRNIYHPTHQYNCGWIVDNIYNADVAYTIVYDVAICHISIISLLIPRHQLSADVASYEYYGGWSTYQCKHICIGSRLRVVGWRGTFTRCHVSLEDTRRSLPVILLLLYSRYSLNAPQMSKHTWARLVNKRAIRESRPKRVYIFYRGWKKN